MLSRKKLQCILLMEIAASLRSSQWLGESHEIATSLPATFRSRLRLTLAMTWGVAWDCFVTVFLAMTRRIG